MDGYAQKSVVDEDAMLDRERYSPSPCGTDVAPAIVVGTKEVRIAKGIHAAIDLFFLPFLELCMPTSTRPLADGNGSTKTHSARGTVIIWPFGIGSYRTH